MLQALPHAFEVGGRGAVDVEDGVTQAVAPWGQYYYHYNDLGTVYATTTAAGVRVRGFEGDTLTAY